MFDELIENGYACLRQGGLEAARMRFQHAIDIAPERPQGYLGLARTYIDQESGKQAIQTLKRALDVDPMYTLARAFLGIELLKQCQVDEAEAVLEQALNDDPTNLLVHIKYAEYYYRLGSYHRAVGMLEQGLQTPHGANEYIVALARRFLVEARQKSNTLLPCESRDLWPVRLLRLVPWSPFREQICPN